MFKKIIPLVCILLLLVFVVSCAENIPEINWNIISLGSKVPKPKSMKIKIYSNTSEDFSISVYNTSYEEYTSYLADCKNKGYIVDAKDTTGSYSAYNEEGYKLSLFHSDYSNYMSVDLDVPIEFSLFEFPIYANDLPTPKSNMGKYNWKNSDSFYLYVGNMSLEDYRDYVLQCVEAGFTISKYESNTVYYADNAAGSHVSLNYEGFNTMRIEYNLPKKQEDNVDTEGNTSETINNGNNSVEEQESNITIDNNSDFKKLLALRDPSDSYIATFAEQYKGKLVEFDGCIIAMNKHGGYNTRYDILLGAGDFDENSTLGPAFRLTDVGVMDLDLDTLWLEDVLSLGTNIHIVAKLDKYNSNTTIYELDIISITVR